MKKGLLSLVMLMAGMAINAQTTLNENGVYEKKVVVQYDSVPAQTLYLRALEALSDWTGSEGKSSFGIDHKDKESATVIFKGKAYMGYRKFMAYGGWNVWAEFTLKVRCKDGKAQLSAIVPSMWFEYNANAHTKGSVPLSQIKPEFTYKGLNLKKAAVQYIEEIPKTMDELISFVSHKMNIEVDDF